MTTRYLGAPIARNEDRRLLTGRALFVNDVERPGMLQVAFLRSPHAHARLGTVDLSRVRARQGVVAAYAADDLGNYWKPGPLLVPPPPIEGTIFNQRSALGERQRWQALSNLPDAGGTANSNPSSSSGESANSQSLGAAARPGEGAIAMSSRAEVLGVRIHLPPAVSLQTIGSAGAWRGVRQDREICHEFRQASCLWALVPGRAAWS